MNKFILVLAWCMSAIINSHGEPMGNDRLNEINCPITGKNADFILEKLEETTPKDVEHNFFVTRSKHLLEWNREKLTRDSKLNIEDLKDLFAQEFVVIANGRKYDANYQNYYEFLKKFRSDIKTIDYHVEEYIVMGSTVVMPLKAIVDRFHGKEDIFDAILLIKFNDAGKIIHWQEVYSLRQ